MQVADVETVRTVRRELARHQIDVSMVHVSAHYGVVHLTGEVRPIRGYESAFEQAILALERCLRQRPGVREVLFEWDSPAFPSGLARKASF